MVPHCGLVLALALCAAGAATSAGGLGSAGAQFVRSAGTGPGVNARRKPAPYTSLGIVPSRSAVEALPRISIDEFGAIAGDSSTGAALANARAIEAAVRASAGSAGVAVVPAGFEYDILPVELANLTDASLLIEGTLSVHQNISAWPLQHPGAFKPVISLSQSTGFALLGTEESLIEGHGLEWWWVRVLNIVDAETPTLVYASHCEGTLVSGVRTSNSPRFNFYLEQQRALEVERVHIWTDWGGAVGALERTGRLTVSHSDARGLVADRMAAETDAPREAALAAVDAWIDGVASSGISGAWHAASLTVRMMAAESSDAIPFPGIPMYPLNTDGVDVAGQGIWIHDCNVTNWDDSYCVKPQTLTGGGSIGCSQNITIEDSIVLFGVGASMGSVPPHLTVNCIRDVTVRNISFTAPTKTLYVKTNGGDKGTGIIENVHYSDIHAKDGFWYPVYVGPQQQKEPNGGGDGWWPPTQPRITVGNITFSNIQMEDVLWPQPGVLRCNVTNPCRGIDMHDVTLSSSLWNASTFQWVCDQTYGAFDGLVPLPSCKNGPASRTQP
ncbi:hypothetical protein FNF31_02182 [Cafeteria roenbergensis]|uniref:Pectate lyase superfamily protein domain-containing protein n=1 Tax=Cafeteria roenbergensis TaxID=33653 RepID=A0A5A8DLK2_CAFRO|nr:hypothetical protein FNF31_02182 [Cafeteria roenbergensis]